MRGLLLATMISAASLLLACESSSGTSDTTPPPADVPGDPGVPDPGPSPDAVTDSGVDTVTGATKLILTDAHPGWNQPKCWDCHTADDHNDGKDPYLCIGCHGTDGAPHLPSGHTGTPPCLGCHGTVTHQGDGFPDPLSCTSCHTP